MLQFGPATVQVLGGRLWLVFTLASADVGNPGCLSTPQENPRHVTGLVSCSALFQSEPQVWLCTPLARAKGQHKPRGKASAPHRLSEPPAPSALLGHAEPERRGTWSYAASHCSSPEKKSCFQGRSVARECSVVRLIFALLRLRLSSRTDDKSLVRLPSPETTAGSPAGGDGAVSTEDGELRPVTSWGERPT